MSKPILFVHGITEIGGAERELLVIAERLPQRNFIPLAVCPDKGPLTEELAQRHVETRFAAMPPWRKIFAYPQRAGAVHALREVILASRPALIHVNDFWWVPQTLRAAAGLGIPVIAHVRQEIEPAKAGRYQLEKADLVLPMSSHIARSLEKGGVPADRLRVLHSCVNLEAVPSQEDGGSVRRSLGIPPGAPVLGTVANLFARKGYEIMLRALPAILKSSPDVHYVIVGKGDAVYETRLKNMVQDLGLEQRVHFAGFLPVVFPCLAAMDVYVHPALMEGFGIAVLEAMAMRKPVVASATGGVPEIVQDGHTGTLVPPGDVEALTREVRRLLEDESRRRQFGEAGRTRVAAQFTVDIMMGRLTAAYEGLLRRSVPAEMVGAR